MPSFTIAGALSLAVLAGKAVADCASYGIDFQDGGSYFQNITSTDDFSFDSVFEGCQPDVCNNILVDPNGDEYQCSDTNLTPDDTDQLSTCPMQKDQMWTGDWSVILISNNGDADPIAYQRDFSLTVASPVTETYTPTVTVSITATPYVNVTTTSTSTSSVTTTSTITSPLKTTQKTTTVVPARVTSTRTITMGTVKKTAYTVVPTIITKTHTQTCSIPARQPWQDPWCNFTPTLVHAAALETSASSTSSVAATTTDSGSSASRRRRADNVRRVPADRAQRVAERKARLASLAGLQERGLDVATTTITDLNTADYATTTTTSTASTSTISVTAINTTTVTSTTTTTVLSGTTTLKQVTITAPTPTKTNTKYTLITTTVTTVTKKPTLTVTITTAPASSTKVCTAKGGKLVA